MSRGSERRPAADRAPSHIDSINGQAEQVIPSVTASTGRRQHCKRGHQLRGRNVYRRPSRPGWRECVTCRRAWLWQAKRAYYGESPRPFEDAEAAVWGWWPEVADDARDGES